MIDEDGYVSVYLQNLNSPVRQKVIVFVLNHAHYLL